jgi:hypothetical protein
MYTILLYCTYLLDETQPANAQRYPLYTHTYVYILLGLLSVYINLDLYM